MTGTLSLLQLTTAAVLLTTAMAQPVFVRSPFRGRVLDPSHAPIAGATITALADGGARLSAVSDQNGEFVLQLAPGNYRLTVKAEGFVEASERLSAPGPDDQVRDFVLQIADSHQFVTVTEAAGYAPPAIRSATKTLTPLSDVPQSVTVVTRDFMSDEAMKSIADVVQYAPGITAIQGENNRDQVVIRGNSSSADFFIDGMRDDVQYYRDLYNLERVEALKGPNAMIFGRGGGGGVINRVTKEAEFAPFREISLFGGSFAGKRFTTDFDQPLGAKAAFRFNGMYEDSDSFRNYVNLRRFGLNPTLTIKPGERTRIALGYEHLRDDRVADRGIPSFQGRPADAPVSTYFGNPDQSHAGARVNLGSALIEHEQGRFDIRNRLLVGDYDRGYQNFVPGAVSADKTQVAISAYNNATRRRNVINQTDVTYTLYTGGIRHTLLAGAEESIQPTDNFRNTGYFNDSATSILAPYSNPLIRTPVTFRQSATDANNHVEARVAAGYVQDQIELSRYVQVIGGFRFDWFALQYHDNRSGNELQRIDHLASPRAAMVLKPVAAVSIYGSYSVSYLPSAGDQFSSLTNVTQQLKPEQFTNYEAGVKWDLQRHLSLTAAAFRLDRTNTRATDPSDPTRIVQTGAQRTNGFELGWNGAITRAWSVAGGYAYQDAYVVSATASARAGAQVAQAPHHTFSLWNRCQILPKLGAGLGVLNRADMFAAIDNTVTLPGWTRVDAALYYWLTENVRLQANVENLFDRKYFVNADGNNNISPGTPRGIRVGLTARF